MQIRISFQDSAPLPVAGAALGLVAGCHMRYLVTFFISAFLLASNSEAADYYWEWGKGRGADPLSVCASALSDWRVQRRGFTVDYPIPLSQPQVQCRYEEYWDTYEIWLSRYLILTRFGDSCPAHYIWSPKTGSCAPNLNNCLLGTVSANGETICTEPPILDANKGLPPPDLTCAIPSDRVGNPINISIGNKVQTVVDAPAASGSLISLARTYNSADGVWRHSYSTRLEKIADAMILVRADGRETKFQLQDGVNSYGIAASGIL
ncbi:DUF6531 domain-containing protein, partial [Pseudomonas otitidis]|uniref:DUF6531 domain-containing protein n=1 Tax=Metapseudomonas otitidis TaxID=319939 RepID=UPI002E7C1426